MWRLACSLNKGMLCSTSSSELGPIASLLWGTCWKCPSQDLWVWGWRTSLSAVCYRVFACNQPDWSRRQSSRPAMFFPACLCSREKKKEAEISRDALAGTFAIPLSRRAAKKILVRVLCLTSSFTCPGNWQLGSLSISASVFCNTSVGKKVCPPPIFLTGCVPRTGWVFLLTQSNFYICCFSLIVPHCDRASWINIECAEKKDKEGGRFPVPLLLSLVLIRGLWCWFVPACLLQLNECFLHLWKWKRIFVSADLLLTTM